MNVDTLIEREEGGRIRRYGGTASMDRTFADIPITRIHFPFDETKWSPRDVERYTKLLRAIETERVLRLQHRGLEPEEHELWDDYKARMVQRGSRPSMSHTLTLVRAKIPDVFAIQPGWPPDMPARWESLRIGMSDGTILMGWMADFDEKRQRNEDAVLARIAKNDLASMRGCEVAVRTFRRAMRRLEAHAKRARVGRGTIACLRQTRVTLGLSPYRLSKRDVGFDKSRDHLHALSMAYRSDARRTAIRSDPSWARKAAWFYERAAENVRKLAAAVRARANAARAHGEPS